MLVTETATPTEAIAASTPAGSSSSSPAAAGPDIVRSCATLKAAGRRVVVVDERDALDLLHSSVHAGADAYIGRESSLADLDAAIAAAGRGDAFVPAALLGPLLRSLPSDHAGDVALARVARLSERERAVLHLLADGADHEAIAAALFVSTHTVRTHLRNLYRKLGVHSRKEAVRMVAEHDALDRLAAAEVALDG